MKKTKTYKPRKWSSNKKYGKKRTSARQKGYDNAWDRYRRRFLHYNKSCYCCGGESTVVDHIVAHKGDTEKFKDIKNHMPLCAWCHNTITGKFDQHKIPLLKEKSDWINRKRKEMNISIAIKVLDKYEK